MSKNINNYSPYSPSRIQTYFNCPKQFQFRYIDGKRASFQSIEAFLGSVIHSVLEWAAKDIANQNEDKVREKYSNEWKRLINQNTIKIIRNNLTEVHYREWGDSLLATFFQRPDPFPGETLKLEYSVQVKLDSNHILRGIIDRLSLEDGELVITDYKSGSRKYGEESHLRQLKAYSLAIFKSFPNYNIIRIRIDYLVTGEKIEERISRKDSADTIRRDLLTKINEIETAKEFPPTFSRLCEWCGYKTLCD